MIVDTLFDSQQKLLRLIPTLLDGIPINNQQHNNCCCNTHNKQSARKVGLLIIFLSPSFILFSVGFFLSYQSLPTHFLLFVFQTQCFYSAIALLLRCNCTAFTQELNYIAFSRPMCWGCKAGAMRLKRGIEA